jgi:hypothetical protein
MTTIDPNELTTVSGAVARFADKRLDLVSRLDGATPQQLRDWDRCVAKAAADLSSDDPARQAQGLSAKCLNLLPK